MREDLYSRVVYSAKAAEVNATIVDGRDLADNKRLAAPDEEDFGRGCPKETRKVLERADKGPSV